jgi:hypothetical protein
MGDRPSRRGPGSRLYMRWALLEAIQQTADRVAALYWAVFTDLLSRVVMNVDGKESLRVAEGEERYLWEIVL